MIDIDRLDEELERALTESARSSTVKAPKRQASPRPTERPARPEPPKRQARAPRPAREHAARHRAQPPRSPKPPVKTEPKVAKTPASNDPATRLTSLIAGGRLEEADAFILAHAQRTGREGAAADRRDAAAWATMRAILDGRRDEARQGSASVLALGRQAGDQAAWPTYLWQRYSIVTQWGAEQECYDLLDECRERAYCHDDLTWRGALTLLLAGMGKTDEATTEFDVCVERGLRGGAVKESALDVATNLAEAAWLLSDRARAAKIEHEVVKANASLVVVDRALVCKGSIERYRGLVAATLGQTAKADGHFESAVDVHRRLGAEPALARTLQEWGTTLARAGNPEGSAYLEEGLRLARSLKLSALVSGHRAAA